MARNNNRQSLTRAMIARRPGSNGGTTAPRSAARGNNIGVGRVRPAQSPGGRSRPAGTGKPRAKAGPNAAGPNPSAPFPPTAAPTPWSSKYEQTVAGANKRYLDATNDFDLAEQTAKQDYGLDPGFNDYKSNPYSRAALLEQSYQTANRGTMNSAGLQLYSGSTSNRLNANRATNAINRDSLAKSYRDALQEISTGRTKAAEDKAREEQEAYWDRIAEAEANEPEAAAAPAASGGAKAKAKKGNGGGNKGKNNSPVSRARKAR